MPPLAPRIPHITELHDERRSDDYFWLREKDDPEVQTHLKAEAAYAEAWYQPYAAATDKLFEEIKGRIQQRDSAVPQRRGAWWYSSRIDVGQQCPIFFRTPAAGPDRQLDPQAPEAILRQHRVSGLSLLAFARQPEWLQLLALLVVKDFIQWHVHFALHHIPALWEFHKTHHSTEVMDWLSNWRFHWLEIVVYQTVLYLPANLLGMSPPVTFGCAVISTTIGHFAHANRIPSTCCSAFTQRFSCSDTVSNAICYFNT